MSITATRDALVAFLNDQALTPDLTAVAAYEETDGLDQLASGRLLVIPNKPSAEMLTFSGDDDINPQLDVIVQYKTATLTTAELDPYLTLSETIAKLCLGATLSNNAQGIEVEWPEGAIAHLDMENYMVLTVRHDRHVHADHDRLRFAVLDLQFEIPPCPRSYPSAGSANCRRSSASSKRRKPKKIVTAGLRVAGKVILGVAKKEAPKLSGNLKKSLGVFKTKHAKRGTIKLIVGPRTNFFPKAYYPAFIEWGHPRSPRQGPRSRAAACRRPSPRQRQPIHGAGV